MADATMGAIAIFPFNGRVPYDWALCTGQLLTIQQNAALYSLIGTTFGGDAKTNFGLPDLRGRTVVGASTGPVSMPTSTGSTAVPLPQGAKGGFYQVTLSAAQTPLPAHTHTATFTGTGGGAGSPATFPQTTVSLTANLKVSTKAANSTTASGNTLANVTNQNPDPVDTYVADSAPAGTMANVVTGSVTIPQTNITGGGGGITGGTVAVAPAVANATQALTLMPPYMAIYYYICTNGLYPNFQ